jgi:hypothetical protein
MPDDMKVAKITYNNGTYLGQYYLDDQGNAIEDGVGIYTWSNGDTYEGEYRYGMRSGHGRMVFANGHVYEGEFKDDVRSGTGRLEWKDGTVYEGDFLNGKMSGKGKLVWPAGDFYVGWFKDDRMEGHGIHYAKDGAIIYDGDWVENCPVGIVTVDVPVSTPREIEKRE